MILMMTWSNLIGLHSWLHQVQLTYRHDTRPFLLPLVKGLACQTKGSSPRLVLGGGGTIYNWRSGQSRAGGITIRGGPSRRDSIKLIVPVYAIPVQ